MEHTFGKEPCEACKEYTEKEYWKGLIRGAIDFIRWRELAFIIVLFTIFYLTLGWIGLVIAPFIHWLTATNQGGAVADITNDWPAEVIPPNICVAGKENCEICNEMGFNENYEKEDRWYKIW